MALTVKLPPYDIKKEYSLFIKSKIIYLNKVNEFGTIVICEGCGIAFYSASNSRRALIFAELSENDYSILLQEKKYGNKIYELGTVYCSNYCILIMLIGLNYMQEFLSHYHCHSVL